MIMGLWTSLPPVVETAVFDLVATVPEVEAEVPSLLNILSICKVSIVVLRKSILNHKHEHEHELPQMQSSQLPLECTQYQTIYQ